MIGLNPLSIPAAREAVERSRSSGAPMASAPFTLTQETGEQIGVVVYQAIRQTRAGDHETVGMVSTALRIDDLLASALANDSDKRAIEHCLVDRSSPQPARLSGATGCETLVWFDKVGFSSSHPIAFAGRDWEVRLRAADA
ncbi:CHASE domain-containing protein, partial [Arthrospira platensis SPKY1]|nr:CHASE domain-containing protein [Arthrospira platensis SPKY1]